MNYFKKNDEVFAFDDDQLDLVTEDFVEMTADEIDQHLNPQNYLTEDEKLEHYRSQFTVLTRRQFKLILLENNLLNQIETSIRTIEDEKQRQRISIEYEEATEFHRYSDSVLYMCQMLQLTDEQVDEVWLKAMTL